MLIWNWKFWIVCLALGGEHMNISFFSQGKRDLRERFSQETNCVVSGFTLSVFSFPYCQMSIFARLLIPLSPPPISVIWSSAVAGSSSRTEKTLLPLVCLSSSQITVQINSNCFDFCVKKWLHFTAKNQAISHLRDSSRRKEEQEIKFFFSQNLPRYHRAILQIFSIPKSHNSIFVFHSSHCSLHTNPLLRSMVIVDLHYEIYA